MEKRLHYIDWAKAIGIVLICVGHFLPKGDVFKVMIYAFHVPLFAFVSGLLTRTPTGISDLFKKIRGLVLRLFIPYTVWHLLSAWLFLARGQRTLEQAWSTYLFLDGMTLWNDALWYAPCIFLVSIVFYLICLATKGNKFVSLGVSAMSFTAFVLIDKLQIPVKLFGHDNFFSAQNLLMLLGFLSLGYLCKDLIKWLVTRRESPYKNSLLYVCAALFFVLLAVAELCNHGNRISPLYRDYNDIVIFSVFAILLVITIVPACALLPRSRIADSLSRHSMFIMCSHLFLYLWWIKDAGIKNAHETVSIRWSYAINAVLLFVVLCLVFDALCRRFPVAKRLLQPFGMKF